MKQLMSLVGAGMIGGLIAFGGITLVNNSDKPISNKEVIQPTNHIAQLTSNKFNRTQALSSSLDFTTAAQKSMPAVVHITAKGTQKVSNNSPNSPFFDLEEFFYGSPNMERPIEGSGSGVISTKDGYIITNNHVIKGANDITVTLYDQREFKAKVVGADPSTDIAVLKIQGNNLTTLPITNSDDIQVGEWVLAVGNPLNLTSTVTAGIVSAKGRNINILGGGASIESFIQTDAAVNPGNSGGALVNTRGQLVGINTAIASRTGSYTGYSFAVPSNIVKKVMNDLIKYGEVQRGFLGISIETLNNELANDLGVRITEGVHVVSVVPTGGAAEGGVQTGDVITSVNNKTVRNAPELQEAVGIARPGDRVKLLVNRNGIQKELSVKLKKGMPR